MSQSEHTRIWDKAKTRFSRLGRKKKLSSPVASSVSKSGDQVAQTDLTVAPTSATARPTTLTAPDTTPRDAPVEQNRQVPETGRVLETGGSYDAVVQVRRTVAVRNSVDTSDSDGSNHHLGAAPPLSSSPDTSAAHEQTIEVAYSASEAIENVGTEEEHVTNNASSAVDEKLWYSEKTPKWNEAVEKWKAQQGEEFAELMRSAKVANGSAADESGDWLFKLRPVEKSSKQTVARLKRWRPVLADVRGIAMTTSAVDPHNIAPIVCASLLFGLDILFNCMSPEDREKILDILCQCENTIQECNSFEINFVKASHPSIQSKMPKVNKLLVQQYSTALNLAYKIRHACQGMQRDFVKSPENQTAGQNQDSKPTKSRTKEFSDWFKRRGRSLWNKMSNEVREWERDSKELGRLKVEWGRKKDDLEEIVAADEHTAEVIKWLAKEDYPDPSPHAIKERVMRHDEYSNGADWFLESDEFTAFCNGFRSSSKADRTQDSRGPPEEPQAVSHSSTQKYLAAKRVLWLHGGYGTGKTTILYLAYLALSTYAESQLEGANDLRIIPYFCNSAEIGTKRADCETIIRAMIRRMALSPDLTLAKPATDLYIERQSATAEDGEPSLHRDWEPLFEKLIEINLGKCHFVLLVDALDECADASEWETLLHSLNGVINKYANISLICSSHAHVELDSFFTSTDKKGSTDIVVAVHVTEKRPLRQLKRISLAILDQEEHKSLIVEFEKLLLAKAKGMFRWVEIWLELLIPETQVAGKTIEFDKHAKQRLKELEEDTTPNFDPDQRLTKAYQRLWDLNSTADSEFLGDIRTRLFQLIQVAAEPLNTKTLSAILRVQSKAYENYPTADNVRSLFANFLEEYDASLEPQFHMTQLRYVHESAREFIINSCRLSDHVGRSKTRRETYEKQSHLSIARAYIDAFACHAHPMWQRLGFDLRGWRDVALNPPNMKTLFPNSNSWPQWRAFKYLTRHGLYHCGLAADKRSLFDPLWREVLDRVILSSEWAFGMIISRSTLVQYQHEILSATKWPVIRKEHDRFEILPAHILAFLDIIHEDDLVVPYDTSHIKAASTADNNHVIRRSLFQHAYNTGFSMQRKDSRIKPVKATALQLACLRGNCAAARMIFQAAQSYCDDPLKSLLLNESLDCSVPLGIAIDDGRFDLAQTLLKLERSATSGKDFNADSSSAPKFMSKQWSCRIIKYHGGFGESLLFRAWEMFEVSEICQLLEIAQPEDSNASDEDGETLLHRAARYGHRRTVCILVDICGANPNARMDRDLTPADCAAAAGHEGVVADLQARGADIEAEIPE
ncbi:MAG: hypothetical protein M1822_009612 [Bathelium mastoideum]|nr:MAG: hypothetical protein M1822_009612 [Bathelium mastoideum]